MRGRKNGGKMGERKHMFYDRGNGEKGGEKNRNIFGLMGRKNGEKGRERK